MSQNKTLRLLVVDDEVAVAELIRMTASDAGFLATAVCDGVDFSAPEFSEPDLIVMDLQMPGRDGIEMIRDLASRRRGAPVVLVSGLGERMLATASELATAQGLKVMAALSKPFSYDDLFDALLTAKRKLPAEAEPIVPDPQPADADDLRSGILRHEIQVLYQPIVSLSTGRATGAEALARWQHPRLGILLPGEFVPVAERHHIGGLLNWAVLETAISDMKTHFPHSLPPVPVSINFNADDISDLELPDRISTQLDLAEMPAEALTIELTESAMIHDLPRALDTMIRLRMKGIGVWLDDFGTGYSSMEQLRRLPVTAVKIDRSFMPVEGRWESNLTLLQSLTDLARKLGLITIAEGVETPKQLEALQKVGCDAAQGFHIGRPMDAEMFAGWLEGHGQDT